MGTSTSARELAGKFATYERRFSDMRQALIPAAEVGKTIFRAAAAAEGALGASLHGKRKPIGVRDDFVGRDAVVVTYTGPAHLVNNPTHAHPIVASGLGGKTRRARVRAGVRVAFGLASSVGGFNGTGKRALTIGSDRRGVVFHPGTRGKHFYEKARPIVVHQVPPIVQRRVHAEWLRDAFGL